MRNLKTILNFRPGSCVELLMCRIYYSYQVHEKFNVYEQLKAIKFDRASWIKQLKFTNGSSRRTSHYAKLYVTYNVL